MTFTVLDAGSVIDAKDNAVRHKRVACSLTKASVRNHFQLEDEIVVVECSGLMVPGRLSKMRTSDSTFVIEVGLGEVAAGDQRCPGGLQKPGVMSLNCRMGAICSSGLRKGSSLLL